MPFNSNGSGDIMPGNPLHAIVLMNNSTSIRKTPHHNLSQRCNAHLFLKCTQCCHAAPIRASSPLLQEACLAPYRQIHFSLEGLIPPRASAGGPGFASFSPRLGVAAWFVVWFGCCRWLLFHVDVCEQLPLESGTFRSGFERERERGKNKYKT